MKDQLEKIKQLAERELDKCENLEVLENLRVRFLGKKGELTAILKQMGSLSAEERPVVGHLKGRRKDRYCTLSQCVHTKAHLPMNRQTQQLREFLKSLQSLVQN